MTIGDKAMRKVSIEVTEQKNIATMLDEFTNKVEELIFPSEITVLAPAHFGLANVLTKKKNIRQVIAKPDHPYADKHEKLRSALELGDHKIAGFTLVKNKSKTKEKQVPQKKQTKKQFYYAIKEGNGVKETIVNTWDECKSLVHGYPSVYKKFASIEECYEYFGTVNVEKVKEQTKWALESKKKTKASQNNILEVKMSDELFQDLEKKSKSIGLPMEHLVRFALNNYLY